MAYDIESDRMILFGGQTGNVLKDSSHYNGETWAYDVAANKWTQMKPPSGPTARGAAELAYDAESDRVILFGGGNQTGWGLDDTWAYDYNTNTWTEMAKGPAKHLGARLAYDAQSDRIILFGGYDMGNVLYNDTWAYDYNKNTWTEMKPSTSPPGRNYQAMTYDSKADRVLVFGGLDLMGNTIDISVWSYNFNNNTWQEKIPGETNPGGRDYPAMVYDAESERTIQFGGVPYGGNETWVYDYKTNTWTNPEPDPHPSMRSRHAMAYSTVADRVILFGGQLGAAEFKYTGETWSYDLNTNTWTNVTPQP
jgi:N-acetylneuraminic acid mutarotase